MANPTAVPRVERFSPERLLGVPLPTGVTRYTAAFILLLILSFIVFRLGEPGALAFNVEAVRDVGNILAPLVLIAAFVERAVEVLITPVRGDQTDRIQARINERAAAGDDVSEYERTLREYRMGTRRYAFFLSVSIGVLTSLFGARALEPLLVTPPAMHSNLQFFDIMLTGVVLGGGAHGIHKVVQAFTDFMERSSRQSKAAANAIATAHSGVGQTGP